MKILFAVLLFVSAAEAIYNLVGLPDERIQQIEHLLKDKRMAAKPSSFQTTAGLGDLLTKVQLNDLMADANNARPNLGPEFDGGSGVNPEGPDAIKKAVESIVKALHKIIPAIKILKEARDNQSHVYAREFVAALKNNSDDDNVKALLGRHAMSLHKRCMAMKLTFAKHAHQKGLLDSLGPDDLDFTDIMGKVLEKAEKDHGADIFEEFVDKAHEHGIQDHPGVKVIMAVGGLIAEVACDVKLDGLLKKIGELVDDLDPQVDFEEGLEDRVISFLYNKKNKKCSTGLVQSLKPERSMQERLLNLVFSRCQEVRLVRFAVDTAMKAIQLRKQVSVLQRLAHQRTMKIASKVASLLNSSLVDDAHQVLGEFVLTEIRRGFLVGIAIHKLQTSRPKPTRPMPSGPRPSSPKPSGPKPSSPVPSSGAVHNKRDAFVEDESNLNFLPMQTKAKRHH